MLISHQGTEIMKKAEFLTKRSLQFSE
jgi:hypothetical protein